MRITIHQPESFCWLGLLDKIRKADLFVILDNVQFEKNYFHNRNKTKNGDSFLWLTIPVKKSPLNSKINEILIDNNQKWKEKILGILYQCHRKEVDFKKHYTAIEKILNNNYDKLVDLNIEIIRYLMYQFEIKTPIVIASEMDLELTGDGSNKVLQICKYFQADEYISGVGGKNYLREEEFEGIKIKYNNYHGYPYSALDLLLCGRYLF